MEKLLNRRHPSSADSLDPSDRGCHDNESTRRPLAESAPQDAPPVAAAAPPVARPLITSRSLRIQQLFGRRPPSFLDPPEDTCNDVDVLPSEDAPLQHPGSLRSHIPDAASTPSPLQTQRPPSQDSDQNRSSEPVQRSPSAVSASEEAAAYSFRDDTRATTKQPCPSPPAQFNPLVGASQEQDGTLNVSLLSSASAKPSRAVSPFNSRRKERMSLILSRKMPGMGLDDEEGSGDEAQAESGPGQQDLQPAAATTSTQNGGDSEAAPARKVSEESRSSTPPSLFGHADPNSPKGSPENDDEVQESCPVVPCRDSRMAPPRAIASRGRLDSPRTMAGGGSLFDGCDESLLVAPKPPIAAKQPPTSVRTSPSLNAPSERNRAPTLLTSVTSSFSRLWS